MLYRKYNQSYIDVYELYYIRIENVEKPSLKTVLYFKSIGLNKREKRSI